MGYDKDALQKMVRELEEQLYIGEKTYAKRKLCNLLGKLGIKSARPHAGLQSGAPLQVESLDATLKQVTFDDTNLKLWKKL